MIKPQYVRKKKVIQVIHINNCASTVEISIYSISKLEAVQSIYQRIYALIVLYLRDDKFGPLSPIEDKVPNKTKIKAQ